MLQIHYTKKINHSDICELCWTRCDLLRQCQLHICTSAKAAGNHIYHKKYSKSKVTSKLQFLDRYYTTGWLLHLIQSFYWVLLPLISFHPKLNNVTRRAPSFTIFMRRKFNLLAQDKHAPLFLQE